jgi:hypothetical protein
MKCVLSFLLVLTGLIGQPASSSAEVIYSQTTPAEPIGAFSSQNKTGSQKIADSFVLLGDDVVTIKSLRFIGGYGLTAPPPLTPALDALPLDTFRVTFMEDSGGDPGMPVTDGDFVLAKVVTRNPAGGPLLNGIYSPIEYGVNIGSGVTLMPSTPYWVSITNDAGEDYFWDWARGTGSLDDQVVSTFGSIESGPWQIGSSGGMWFELNDQNIPEPATCVLLGVAATAAGLRRIKRHI